MVRSSHCRNVLAAVLAVFISVASLVASASKNQRDLSSKKAAEIVEQLPEVQAWVSFIHASTNGKHKGSCIVPWKHKIKGDVYWIADFVEVDLSQKDPNTPCWEHFLVHPGTGKVYVYDCGGSILELDFWRKHFKPMERIKESDPQ